MLRTFVLVVVGSGFLWGQCASSSEVFPHLVDGSGWKSSLYLVNESVSAQADYTLKFRGDGAQPVLIAFTDGRRDNQISGTISGGGLAILETPGLDADPLAAATATLTTSGALSGFTVIRQRQAGQPDREVTIPLSNAAAHGLTFPFDNTGSFQSSIALTVLCGPNATVALTATATDEAGAPLGQSELKMPQGGHTAFMAAGQLPGTKGKRGLIRISSQGTGVQLAGLGLRVGAAGALTYFPPSASTLPVMHPVAHPVHARAKK
jgi:hypothetical protein